MFYYKLKADLNRYKIELCENEEEKKAIFDICDNLYIYGIELGRGRNLYDSLLLSIQCSYCVFLYDSKGLKNDAIEYLSIVLDKINDAMAKKRENEFLKGKDKDY